MKRVGLVAMVMAGLVAALPIVLGCGSEPRDANAANAAGAGDLVKHGEYLSQILGCNDCHTPFKMGPKGPEPDMSRLLSGHPHDLVMPPPPALEMPWMWAGAVTNTAFAGPWGVSYAFNLTPDPSGLGVWTEEMFIKAIRSGQHMGGGSRPIMPPMPWAWYSHMTDGDFKALWAYLRSIPAIENAVPEYVPPKSAGAPH